MRIAFLTFGNMLAPWGDPVVAEFEAREEAVFGAAEESPGFVAYAPSVDRAPGAPVRHSPFYMGSPGEALDSEASTLTVWRDLESVFAFAYGGRHLEAFKRRRSWFHPPAWPRYLAWWIGDDELPTWEDAYARQERLHAMGPTPEAFDFHHPFDADGQPTTVRRPPARPGGAGGATGNGA